MRLSDKKISVTQALEHALEEKQQILKKDYKEASLDSDRKKIIEDWQVLDGENWND